MSIPDLIYSGPSTSAIFNSLRKLSIAVSATLLLSGTVAAQTTTTAKKNTVQRPVVKNSTTKTVTVQKKQTQKIAIRQKDVYSSPNESFRSRFQVGVAGGFSLNKFITDQPHGGYNAGYSAGLLLKYRVYKGFGLQLEANSLQQGGQLITFKDDTRYGLPENFQNKNVKNSSYTFNSLEIPLLVNYTFNRKGTWQPVIYAGASYAHNFNVAEDYQKTGNLLTGEDIIATVNGSQGATNVFRRDRLNFVAGANALLPVTSRFKLLIDCRYETGLTPVRDGYSYMEKAGFGSHVWDNSLITRLGIIMSLDKK